MCSFWEYDVRYVQQCIFIKCAYGVFLHRVRLRQVQLHGLRILISGGDASANLSFRGDASGNANDSGGGDASANANVGVADSDVQPENLVRRGMRGLADSTGRQFGVRQGG